MDPRDSKVLVHIVDEAEKRSGTGPPVLMHLMESYAAVLAAYNIDPVEDVGHHQRVLDLSLSPGSTWREKLRAFLKDSERGFRTAGDTGDLATIELPGDGRESNGAAQEQRNSDGAFPIMNWLSGKVSLTSNGCPTSPRSLLEVFPPSVDAASTTSPSAGTSSSTSFPREVGKSTFRSPLSLKDATGTAYGDFIRTSFHFHAWRKLAIQMRRSRLYGDYKSRQNLKALTHWENSVSSRTMRAWRNRSSRYLLSILQARKHWAIQLQRSTLGLWKKALRTQRRIRALDVESLRLWEKSKLSGALKAWRASLRVIQKAREASKRNILRKGLAKWTLALDRKRRLKNPVKSLQTAVSKRRRAHSFVIWRSLHKAIVFRRERERENTQHIFDVWLINARKLSAARKIHKTGILRQSLRVWRQDLQKKIGMRMCLSLAIRRRNRRIMERVLGEWIGLASECRLAIDADLHLRQIALRWGISRWRERSKMLYARRMMVENAREHYKAGCLRKSLRNWRAKFSAIMITRLHTERAGMISNKVTTLRAIKTWRHTIRRWSRERRSIQAIQHNIRARTALRVFITWLDLLREKSQTLNELRDSLLAKRALQAWKTTLARVRVLRAQIKKHSKHMQQSRLARITERWRILAISSRDEKKAQEVRSRRLVEKTWQRWQVSLSNTQVAKSIESLISKRLISTHMKAWIRSSSIARGVGKTRLACLRITLRKWKAKFSRQIEAIHSLMLFRSRQALRHWNHRAKSTSKSRERYRGYATKLSFVKKGQTLVAWRRLLDRNRRRERIADGFHRTKILRLVSASFGRWSHELQTRTTLRKKEKTLVSTRRQRICRAHLISWAMMARFRRSTKLKKVGNAVYLWRTRIMAGRESRALSFRADLQWARQAFHRFVRAVRRLHERGVQAGKDKRKAVAVYAMSLAGKALAKWRMRLASRRVTREIVNGKIVHLQALRLHQILEHWRARTRISAENKNNLMLATTSLLRGCIRRWHAYTSRAKYLGHVEEEARRIREASLLRRHFGAWRFHPLIFLPARRLITAFLFPDLRAAVNKWRSYTQHQNQRENLEILSVTFRGKKAVQCWFSNTQRAQMRRARMKRLSSRADKLYSTASLRRVLAAWRHEVTSLSGFRERLAEFRLRRSRRLSVSSKTNPLRMEDLAPGSKRSRASGDASAHSQRSLVISARECIHRIKYWRLQKAMRTWQENALLQKLTRARESRAYKHLTRYTQIGVLRAWIETLHFRRKYRTWQKIASDFFAQRTVPRVFTAWIKELRQRRTQRGRLQHADNMYRARIVGWSLMAWRLATRQILANRVHRQSQERLIELTRLRAIWRRWRRRHIGWQIRLEEGLAMSGYLRALSIFNAWRSRLKYRKHIRQGVQKALAQRKRTAWEIWRRQLHDLHRQRAANRIGDGLEEARAKTMLEKALAAWRLELGLKVMEREALKAFSLHCIRPRCFLAWRRYTQLSKKAINHLVIKTMSKTLKIWRRAWDENRRIAISKNDAVVALSLLRIKTAVSKWRYFIRRRKLWRVVARHMTLRAVRKWSANARIRKRERGRWAALSTMADGFKADADAERLRSAIDVWKAHTSETKTRNSSKSLAVSTHATYRKRTILQEWIRLVRRQSSLANRILGFLRARDTRRRRYAVYIWRHTILTERCCRLIAEKERRTIPRVLGEWKRVWLLRSAERKLEMARERRLCIAVWRAWESHVRHRIRANAIGRRVTVTRGKAVLGRVLRAWSMARMAISYHRTEATRRIMDCWRMAIIQRHKEARDVQACWVIWQQRLKARNEELSTLRASLALRAWHNRATLTKTRTAFNHTADSLLRRLHLRRGVQRLRARVKIARMRDRMVKLRVLAKERKVLELWRITARVIQVARKIRLTKIKTAVGKWGEFVADKRRHKSIISAIKSEKIHKALAVWQAFAHNRRELKAVEKDCQKIRQQSLLKMSTHIWVTALEGKLARREEVEAYFLRIQPKRDQQTLRLALGAWNWAYRANAFDRRRISSNSWSKWLQALKSRRLDRAALKFHTRRNGRLVGHHFQAWRLNLRMREQVVLLGERLYAQRERKIASKCLLYLRNQARIRREAREPRMKSISNTILQARQRRNQKRIFLVWREEMKVPRRRRLSIGVQVKLARAKFLALSTLNAWRRKLIYRTRVKDFFFTVHNRRLRAVLQA
ncbi:hypothetical protein AAMO2058_000367200 [Amorphochlora amoebiformis]